MGYYATGRGELQINEDDVDEVIGLIGGLDSGWQVVDFCGDDMISVEFDGKYRTDEVRNELLQLRSSVKDGSYIQFTGEDNNVWRMVFEGDEIAEIPAVFLTLEQAQTLALFGR